MQNSGGIDCQVIHLKCYLSGCLENECWGDGSSGEIGHQG